MHVVVVGAGGQLGKALAGTLQGRDDVTLSLWQRPAADITDPAISAQLAGARPDVVINAAAWTDVDGAEEHPAAAYAANALGAGYLAEGCARCGAHLVHISTNEVFPGTPGCLYREYDAPAAGSVYARSKLAGERAVRHHPVRVTIVRVAWLFGPGGQNFASKITVAADRHGALSVVADEYGNPTYAPDAAAAIVRLAELARPGIYHIVNAGCASRFDFARAVLAAGGRSHVPLTPISSKEWPRAAVPPRHAVLVNEAAAALGIVLRPWQEAAAEYGQKYLAKQADESALLNELKH